MLSDWAEWQVGKMKTGNTIQKYFAQAEKGFMLGGCVFHIRWAELKSQSKNNGDVGKCELFLLIASCSSSMKLADDESKQ